MAEQTVLILDGDPEFRERLELTLLRMGLNTVTTGYAREAIAKIREYKPDFCLTEWQLPDGSGLDVVRFLQEHSSVIPVVVITAKASVEAAVMAMKAGASDFVTKPLDLSKLRELIQTVQKRPADNIVSDSSISDRIIGNSTAMQQLNATINKLARSQVPIYIHGESGSGKELVAHQIHQQGARAKEMFIPVNCGAIPETLMESEFFGHKKGSFTGAVADKQGLFQAAHKGTLFLDEVADLPLNMQVKLLRAIQEGAVKPVGGLEEMSVDVRILSATHKNLEQEVASGRFRQDLYYRLNVITLEVPPLRERQTDILLLVDFFLRKIAGRWKTSAAKLSTEALNALQAYHFPGNVRELENVLERASTLCDDNTITISDLYLRPAQLDVSVSSVQQVPMTVVQDEELIPNDVWNPEDADAEKDLVYRSLEYTHWNRTRAAQILGMTFRQLTYRIQKYGLDEYQ